MGRTNIKRTSSSTDYFVRPYATDDNFIDMTQAITQGYYHDNVVEPHSIFSKPYLAKDYGDMEYKYLPWDFPVAPLIQPFEFPELEFPEFPEAPCFTPGSWDVTNLSIVNGRPRSAGYRNISTSYSWATILALSTGNDDDTSFFLRPGFERANWRWFLYFDLTDFCGTVSSADITIPLVYSAEPNVDLSIHEGTFDQGVSTFSWYGGIDRVSPNWDIQEIVGTNSGNAADMTWSLSSTGIDYMTSVIDASASKILKFSVTTYLHDIQGVQPSNDIFINSVTGPATMIFTIV